MRTSSRMGHFRRRRGSGLLALLLSLPSWRTKTTDHGLKDGARRRLRAERAAEHPKKTTTPEFVVHHGDRPGLRRASASAPPIKILRNRKLAMTERQRPASKECRRKGPEAGRHPRELLAAVRNRSVHLLVVLIAAAFWPRQAGRARS
jgi:hypothetical protein